MKKYLLCVLIALLVCFLPVLAGEPTEYEIPEVGTEISGFKVVDVSYWETYDTAVVKLEHIKTASVLYWLANDNIDRSYMMAFHTPIYDDTGMPHVFEHATLGGSGKYPGANTFFEMISKTSHTYLNAMTGTFYTMYPMASSSEDQLLKFVDFYMSGLTDPLAISNKYAMMREAYRYELDDPNGEINLQGVVYSEMLGALTQSRWAAYNFEKAMWPGSYVSSIAGGDPEYIPNLTLDAIRAFHEKYYHPGNATMYLTGDIYLPDFLELLHNDFLSKFEYAELEIEDNGYTPLEPGDYEQVFSYAAENGTPTEGAAIMYYAFPFEIDDYNDMELLEIVCNYMNDESSPFSRMMQEQLPEASASMSVDWNPEGKHSLCFNAESINEDDKETFKTICQESLKELLENGVNEEVLQGILVSKQFSDLMQLDSSSVYLNLTVSMAQNWTLFGDRDAWKKVMNFESHMTELATVENLNEAARKYWSDFDTSVMAITVPVPGLKEQNDAALRTKLDEMKAAMTPEEIDALVEETRAYHQFVEESNQITMPDELNALSVETLPEEISYSPAQETNINGIRVITSEIESPLIRVSMILDASTISFEDLLDYLQFASLVENVGTDLYTREELPAKKALVSSNMTMYSVVRENQDTRDLESYFLIAWYALPETLEQSYALVEDILYNADFSDYDYIRSDAAQSYALNQMYMDSNALSLGLLAAGSSYSDIAKYRYYVNTENQLNYWKQLSEKTDEEMDALVEKFGVIRDRLLNKNGVVMTVMGNYENIIRASALGYNLIDKFDDSELEKYDVVQEIAALPLHTAIVTGGNIVYNIAVTDLEAAGYDTDDGGLMVAEGILDDKLLYPELRVKNSAYGGYSLQAFNYLFGFYSYRDPKVAETYGVYETAGDFLRELEMGEEELAGYITSVYGSLTNPIGPLSASLQGINDKVYGEDSYDKTIRKIRDIKAFTTADIAKYADLAEIAGSVGAARSTAGSKSMIESNAELFEYINYNLLDSEFSGEEDAVEDAVESVDEDMDLIAVIENLSPEEIEEMLKDMDEEDLRSLVSYVMDYFTDDDGKMDSERVFELVGAFMNKEWSDAEIAEAVEELEDASEEEPEEDSEPGKWEELFDSLLSELNEENVSGWLERIFSNGSETQSDVESSEGSLSKVLQGIFGAFVNQSND